MGNWDIDSIKKQFFKFTLWTQLIFCVLKLTQLVNWSWLMVLSPILVFSCIFIIIDDSIADS